MVGACVASAVVAVVGACVTSVDLSVADVCVLGLASGCVWVVPWSCCSFWAVVVTSAVTASSAKALGVPKNKNAPEAVMIAALTHLFLALYNL